ncbi:MAG TPA: phosphoribosylamine--glycine ligase [Candidatus Polarisedimenticolia bacterium]|jgi:phosphoribosylamine--glycine ligase
MRILVIGGGGREHALVWKIGGSPLLRSRADLMCVPGNAGIEDHASCLPAPARGLTDVAALADLAVKERIDLTVVGPEAPLMSGLVDELTRRGLAVFGASRAAARLEGSKVFAKEFMQRHGIPTAPFEVFSSCRDTLDWLGSTERSFPIVVKADGLAAGKGVVVAPDRASAQEAARAILEEKRFGAAGERIVIEECLTGAEISFFALTDGESATPLASCQDHKRLGDGDTGPNTGGMGALSPSTDLDPDMERRIMERVIQPAIAGMAEEGSPYRGVLYAGLMLTERGPMVLEYNARFGDPEAQVLMPRLESDLVPLLVAASDAGGRMRDIAGRIRWRPEWAACVVLASAGYPGSPETGRMIRGLEMAAKVPQTEVFHAGTRRERDGSLRDRIVTAGGRVLAVTSLGRDLGEALNRAYAGVECLSFEGMQFRRDIGGAALSRLAARPEPLLGHTPREREG